MDINGTVTRHFIAMSLMAVSVFVGVVLAITVGWQTGVIVGGAAVLISFLFAVANMAYALRRSL